MYKPHLSKLYPVKLLCYTVVAIIIDKSIFHVQRLHSRNRCNSCGCSRSDHKIAGAAQVDIPYLSHLSFGHVPIESSSPALSQLEWYPPDLTDEQVASYYYSLFSQYVDWGSSHRWTGIFSVFSSFK